MTPMIDIVFLLIIFFLVSSHLSRQENRHPVTLSQAAGGQSTDSQTSSLTITIDEAHRLHLAGALLQRDQLRERVSAWLNTRDPIDAEQDLSVRIRIDQSVPYGRVEPIMKELAELGISQLAIVVNPPSGSGSAVARGVP